MKLIKLTDQNGNPLYLDAEHIIRFQTNDMDEVNKTEIEIKHSFIYVKETPDEVAALIEGKPKPKCYFEDPGVCGHDDVVPSLSGISEECGIMNVEGKEYYYSIGPTHCMKCRYEAKKRIAKRIRSQISGDEDEAV